jgi:hypothetical protein
MRCLQDLVGCIFWALSSVLAALTCVQSDRPLLCCCFVLVHRSTMLCASGLRLQAAAK